MTDIPRRHVLVGAVASLPLAAGCVSPFEASPAAGSGDTDDSSTHELEAYDTLQFRYSGDRSDPSVDVHFEAERAMDWFDDLDVDANVEFTHPTHESAADFVEDTDFEHSILVSIVAGASDAGYRLEVTDVSLDGDALSVDAAVGEDPDAGDGTIQVLTTVGALVRATFAETPPTEWSVTITDEDGHGHAFGGAAVRDVDEGSGSGPAEEENESEE